MTYKELLLTHENIRKLSIVQFIAYFGAWFSNVAIYSLLVKFQASSVVIATVTAMHFLPAILMAPLSGAIIDTIDKKKLMIGLLLVEFVCTIGFLFITSIDLVWLLMILVFIRMSASSMFFSSEMSLMPHIVSGEALTKANEIHSIIWSFTYAAGMAVGGVVVDALGVKISFIIDAMFFVFALLIFINIDIKHEVSEFKDKILNTIKEGFIYLKNHKLALHLIVLHSSVGLTSFDTLVTLLADYDYKFIIAVPLSIGISNAVRALALMIGPFLISKYVNKNTLVYLFVFQGVGVIIWAFLQFDFYLALIGLFLTGFVTTTLWSFTYALLQENIEKKYLGRVISYNDMIFMVSNVLTTFFIGVMAQYISLKIITICLGIGFFVFAIYYMKILRRIC